jgi:DNA-binding transcriptional regulator YiaG
MRNRAGEIIRQLERFGLSKEAIAARLHVSVSAVILWKKDIRCPQWATYEKLLQILNGYKVAEKKDKK